MKHGAKICWLWISAALLWFAGVELRLGIRAYEANAPAKAAGLGMARFSGTHFAIADFDGDWKPDLAVVETAAPRRAEGNYAIRLRLSAGAEVSFLISAPSGGLHVAAKDVNGDDLPDLVVSSAWTERIVAVLLNQGHGSFSRAEPAAYAAFAREFELFLHGQDQTLSDRLTVASLRYSFDGERVVGSGPAVAIYANSVSAPDSPRQLLSDSHARRGRSPPALIFLA